MKNSGTVSFFIITDNSWIANLSDHFVGSVILTFGKTCNRYGAEAEGVLQWMRRRRWVRASGAEARGAVKAAGCGRRAERCGGRRRGSATRDLPPSSRAIQPCVCVQLASRLQVVDRVRRAWPSRCVLSSPACSDLSVKVSSSSTLPFGTPPWDPISRRLPTVSRYLTSPTFHPYAVSGNPVLQQSPVRQLSLLLVLHSYLQVEESDPGIFLIA